MKTNPFVKNGSTLIRKKILFAQKIRQLTNNTTNKSNTTNYTGKNHSLSYLALNPTNNSNLFSPQRLSPRNKIKEELIKSANNILSQRMYNKSPIKFLPYGLKRTIINESKEISLKNYMIDLIKMKRNDINNRELLINTSLINSSDKLERDYKNFLNSVDNLKSEQKNDEEKLGKIKMIYDKTSQEYFKQLTKNKRLNESIIKIIKSICTFKRYGSFLHKVFDIPFPYDDIVELNIRIKNYEEVTEKIINIYEHNKNENIIDRFLENEDLLIQKFNYYEEKLMKGLTDKEIIKKENKNRIINEKTELNFLNQKIKIFQEDLNRLNDKKNKILLLTEKYNLNNENNINNSDNNIKNEYNEDNIKDYIGYINEIGKCLGIELKNKNNNNNILQYIKDYYIYCKNTIKCLELKEKYVNEYISKIDNILQYGDNDDKEMILNALSDIKKENKYKKIISYNLQKE